MEYTFTTTYSSLSVVSGISRIRNQVIASIEEWINITQVKSAYHTMRQKLIFGHECGIYDSSGISVDSVSSSNIRDGDDLIKVERLRPRKRAVESGFDETSPFISVIRWASFIVFANSGYSGVVPRSSITIYRFCFYGFLSEEEVYKLVTVKTSSKLRFIEKTNIISFGSDSSGRIVRYIFTVDERITARKVRDWNNVCINLQFWTRVVWIFILLYQVYCISRWWKKIRCNYGFENDSDSDFVFFAPEKFNF